MIIDSKTKLALYLFLARLMKMSILPRFNVIFSNNPVPIHDKPLKEQEKIINECAFDKKKPGISFVAL